MMVMLTGWMSLKISCCLGICLKPKEVRVTSIVPKTMKLSLYRQEILLMIV